MIEKIIVKKLKRRNHEKFKQKLLCRKFHRY